MTKPVLHDQAAPSRATIYTIARAAGVHPSTASRALNPLRSAAVSADTATRVQRIAAEFGYEANPWARSLRTRRTQMIGLLLPRLTDGVVAYMFEAAEDRARELGYQAITMSTHDEGGLERALVNSLLERRVDGMILATSTTSDPLLDELANNDIPFVLMNRSSGQHPVVRADDELGGYLATRHLIGQGHRRIGMAAGLPGVSTSTLRREGFIRAHHEAGLEVDLDLVVDCTFDCAGGVDAGSILLSRADRPTAIFAVNDRIALSVLSVARSLGLQPPGELALVGYNNSELAPLLEVPLSSVDIPLREMGASAVNMLVSRLAGEEPPSVILQPRLIVRASSPSMTLPNS